MSDEGQAQGDDTPAPTSSSGGSPAGGGDAAQSGSDGGGYDYPDLGGTNMKGNFPGGRIEAREEPAGDQ